MGTCPGALGFSDAERSEIRLTSFRDEIARCPRDDASLDVIDMTAFGDRTRRIDVTCTACGLRSQIE
jgi:hypothetical protein